MKCPKCVEDGERSTLTGGVGTTTLMYAAPFYDEDGNYHDHNPNATTTSYQCSRGHRITVTTHRRCGSCDWGSNSDQVTAT